MCVEAISLRPTVRFSLGASRSEWNAEVKSREIPVLEGWPAVAQNDVTGESRPQRLQASLLLMDSAAVSRSAEGVRHIGRAFPDLGGGRDSNHTETLCTVSSPTTL